MLDGALNEGVGIFIQSADAVAEDDAPTGVPRSEAQVAKSPILEDGVRCFYEWFRRADAAQENRHDNARHRTSLASTPIFLSSFSQYFS